MAHWAAWPAQIDASQKSSGDVVPEVQRQWGSSLWKKTAAVMNLYSVKAIAENQLSFGLSAFEPTVPTVGCLTGFVLLLGGRLHFRSESRRFAETTSIQSSD